MKNIEILVIVNAYTEQKQKGDGLKLPAAVAWKRRINLDRLYKAKALIDDAMKELQAKYSDEDHSAEAEDGNGRIVKPEYLQEFALAQSEILAQDTPVTIQMINIEDLGDIVLTDMEMDTIAFMIKEA